MMTEVMERAEIGYYAGHPPSSSNKNILNLYYKTASDLAETGASQGIEEVLQRGTTGFLDTSELFDLYKEEIFSNYICYNEADVKNYLYYNRYLVKPVYDAYLKLRNYFPDSPVFLRVFGSDLVISVGTKLPPSLAIRKLDEFDEDWLLSASEESLSKLCVKVEYL
jgi:hypothetical protein